MKQFLLPREYRGQARMSLLGGDFRYLVRVLRMKEGDEVPALDAEGGRHLLRITAIGEARCEVEIAPPEAPAAAAPPIEITLLQCLPKGRKIDLIVRQATEAGVARIVPLVSEHTVVRPDDGDGRSARLRRIAREAIQQSGNARLPVIEEPRDLASICRGGQWGTGLFLHEKALPGPALHQILAARPPRISIVIGPEGGLSDAEVGLLAAAGFRPVHLGAGVLRVETAAVFALGAVTMIMQETDTWKAVRTE